MTPCDHSCWLGLRTQGADTILQQTDRLQNLIDDLPLSSPGNQCPSLFVLIGKKTKSIVLQELIHSGNSFKSQSTHDRGGVHLHLAESSTTHERPLLYANPHLPTHFTSSSTSRAGRCHERIDRLVNSDPDTTPRPTSFETNEILYSHLLHPFTDVFCLFCTDFGGLEVVADRLVSWISRAKEPNSTRLINPNLLLVVESQVPEPRAERQAKRDLHRMIRQRTARNIFDHFSNIDVICVHPPGKNSVKTRHRSLERRLIESSDRTRRRRLDAGMLFSPKHFAVLFKYACDSFVANHLRSFDFIKASRLRNPVSSELETHISFFLKHVESPGQLVQSAIPLIASSLLLNAYPPDMHVFNPADMFQALYADACLRVGIIAVPFGAKSTSVLLPSGFVRMVEDHFCRLFKDFSQSSGSTSAEIHLRNIRRFGALWPTVQDDNICLICLHGTPDHFLPCKHGFCEACLQLSGALNEENPWVLTFDECIYCQTRFLEPVAIKTRNPSRGLRVLSLDGGGCRGNIHPKFLMILEDRIGLPYPVQENFDVLFCTSSGAVVGLAMAMAGLSAESSLLAFESLATTAFTPRWAPSIPIVSEIYKYIVSYLADGLYPPEGLEAGLKQVFGETMTMSDSSYATATGIKVAVPVTTVRDGFPCIFRNYRCRGEPQSLGFGYHVIRPQNGYSEPLVWEVGRCATAAPGYFMPKHIPGVGAFLDGGVWKNNPVSLGHSELKAIAPLVEKPLVISVGTGMAKEAEVPDTSASRGFWKDGLFQCLCRGLEQHTKGQRQSEEYSNQVSGENYFRFDVRLTGPEPRLDQVNRMPEMAAQAQKQFSDCTEMDVLAHRLRAAHFHFELESMPRETRGQWSGVGYIFCDLERSHPAYQVLLTRISKASARFYLNGSVIAGRIGDSSYIGKDRRFRKRVEFEANDDMFALCLKSKGFPPQHVSGSPFSIKNRIEAQNLNAFFGEANHGKRRKCNSELGERPSQRRRLR